MASLVIVIISVVLVAALALATQYYGASALSEGAEVAKAAQLLNQGLQLRSAAQLYFNDKGYWPSTVDELLTGHYLNALPIVTAADTGFSVLSSAYAADAMWTMPKPGVPTFILTTGFTSGVCKEVNHRSVGSKGIPAHAYADVVAQCYGPALNTLTVVISAEPETLGLALPVGDLGTDNRPVSPTDSGWTSPPDMVVDPKPTADTPLTLGPVTCAPLSVASGSPITCEATVTNDGHSGASTAGAAPTVSDPIFTPTTNCPATLAAGASCKVTLTGTPVAQGTNTYTLGWGLSGFKSASQLFSVTVTPPVETLFVYDDFSGASGPVTSHVGLVGAAWHAYSGNAANESVNYQLDGLGNLFGPGFTRMGFILSSGQPGLTDEYYIELTVKGDPPYDAWNYFNYLTVGVLSPGISIYDGYVINMYNSSQGHQQIFVAGAGTAAGKTTWGTSWYNMGWTPEFSAIEFGVQHVLRFEFYRAKKRILLDGQLLSEFVDKEAGPAGPLYLEYSRGIIVNKVKMAKL